MEKIKNKITVFLVGIFFTVLVLTCFFHGTNSYSVSERRKLAQFPTLSWETVINGKFMSNFESYTQDQFPLRETFRRIKAITATTFLGQKDSHDIYTYQGSAAKLDYPLNDESITHAADRFGFVFDTYLKDTDCNIYLSVIPDKGYFLAPLSGNPSMNYEKLAADLQAQMPYASYIDIYSTLSLEDYYNTDPHWRQEKLQDTANALAAGLGVTLTDVYETNTLDVEYRGVYAGQSALPMKSETIYYLTSPTLSQASVFNWESNSEASVYDMEKGHGNDPYELYLSGPVSLITIENPNASTERELILFRDSYGSSIAPYLFEAYSKVTLIDIRYLTPQYVGKFVTFENQDVLFLYSTLVLNNSETIK